MRGAGPTAILKLLERGEMYGYELVEAIDARTDGILAMGQSTLYPLLYNLEGKGLISSRWDDAGARPRKYYRLTASGRTRLAADSKQWRAVAQAMTALGVVTSAQGVLARVFARTFERTLDNTSRGALA